MKLSDAIKQLQEIHDKEGCLDRLIGFEVRVRKDSYQQGYCGTSGDKAVEGIFEQ
jgi:hypothetical protein